LRSVLRKGKRREKHALDHLSSESRSATDDNPPGSFSPKAESSHTGNQAVIDSVQSPPSKTAPLASRPDIKAFPVSIEESEHPDTGRRLITFAFDADDLLAALLNSKHKSLPPVPGVENIEGTANITVDTSHTAFVRSDVVDAPIVLSAPASKPLEVESIDLSQSLEGEGEEGHSNKSESPCYKFLPHAADPARAPFKIPSLDLEPVISYSDSRASCTKTHVDAEVEKTWNLSSLSLAIAEESLGIGTSEMNPLPRSEPTTVSNHKGSEMSTDYGDELDLGSGHPSPSPPPRVPPGGDSKIQISAAPAEASPKPSLVPYGPPPGLMLPNAGMAAGNPAQDPKVESTHHEPLLVTPMRPARHHEASTSAQAVHFKNQRLFSIFEERINEPSGTDKHLPSTSKDLVIGAVSLPTPEPTPERKPPHGKGKAKCPLDESEIPIEILSPVLPSPPEAEYPKPMGPTSRPWKSKDYRSPILAGKDHKLIGSGTTAVVFRRPSATRGRFRATKVISLAAAPYDIVIDAYVEEVRILQQLSAKKAEAREKGEVDPGMERVMGFDDPDDRMELLSDGRLCISTVSQVSGRALLQPLILEVGLLPRRSE